MAILSWRISWMTTSRSVRPSRSTSGRAPSMSSSMRFWIRAVSLNRPPTLFTISSDLRASIIFVSLRSVRAIAVCFRSFPPVYSPGAKWVLQTPGAFEVNDFSQLFDRAVEIVVKDKEIEGAGTLRHGDLAAGNAEPLLDVLDLVAAPVNQPLHQGLAIGREDEDEEGVGVL